jgi:diadenosine tetraphosphatase ApaH/serine/threonine PP2A family protein phosphatase
MRILIISDIHANLTALDAALKAAEGRWDKALCLGDIVGYGPDPNEVLDRVRGLGALIIRGNHDKASCGLEEPEDFNPVARAAALWTREELTPQNRQVLRDLPSGPLEVDGITAVHGAVHDEDEYVFGPVQALDSLMDSPSEVTFFGHTHVQVGFALHENQVRVLNYRPRADQETRVLDIEPHTRYLLNAGSVGQPRDGDPRASFAIANLAGRAVEFWRVAYDILAVQDRMAAAGLPEPLIARLALGR